MPYFKNKVVWITGASSGFGEALAYELASKGAKLILSARRQVELEHVQAHVPKADILLLDLENPQSFPDIVEQAIKLHGKIDIMIHNAGIGQLSSVLATSIPKHRKIMEIDYFSYTELTKLLLPHFISRQSGHFVITSSLMGKIARPFSSSYCAAKFALQGFFDSLRAEIMSQNINVTLLISGEMKTNLIAKSQQYDDQASEEPITHNQSGANVTTTAKQAVRAIKHKKYEAYIGHYDKHFILLYIARFLPALVKWFIIKQNK